MPEVIVAKPNMANNPAEMEELVQKALARLTLARAWERPITIPLEWFINEVIENG